MKRSSVAVLVLFIATGVLANEPAGKLVFDVQNYESDVKLKKNVRKQLGGPAFPDRRAR
jgi:hypothetical protein